MKLIEQNIYQTNSGALKVDVTATCARSGLKKRVRKTLPMSATIEVARSLREQIAQEIRGEQTSAPSRKTCAAYAADWMERRSARLKPSTRETYRTFLLTYLVPHLGTLYCDALRRSDIEEWATWLEEQTGRGGRPLANATLRSIWRHGIVVLKDLAADHEIADPTLRVRPPSSKRRSIRERGTLTAEELGTLVEAVQRCAPDRALEVEILAYTGIRSGELWGLKWAAVEKGALRIEAAISAGQWVDSTKTGTARRVYLPPHLARALELHRKALMGAQHPSLASGLVFSTAKGTPHQNGTLRATLEAASQEAGLRLVVTPQVLRRTFNTLSVQAGVDRLVLRAQMGHTSEQMTERYAGIQDDAKAAAWDAVFKRGGVVSQDDTPKTKRASEEDSLAR